jgi:DNA replication protein DnaC
MKNIFAPYQGKTLMDFEILHASHEFAVRSVANFVNNIELFRSKGKGLMFMGDSGVGKTFLASLALQGAKDKSYKIEAIELGTFIDLHYQMFNAGHNDDRYDTIYDHLQYIKVKADFVLFDDIGREHASTSGWSDEELFNTFRYRWNRGRPTIFTTNLTLPALAERYTPGFVSLLHEATEIVLVEGEDYRCVKVN